MARREGCGYEPASELLERILVERKTRWIENAVGKARAKAEAKALEKAHKTTEAKYKEPAPPDTTDLPDLPEGWCWVTWEQIGFSQNGRAFPSKEYAESGIRLLRPGNLHVSGEVEWTESNTRFLPETWAHDFPAYMVGPSELVINLTAQSLADQFLGRVCLTGSEERCLLNQRIARLIPIIVNPRFLLWLFKTPLFRRFVDSLNTGSLIQHMFTSQLAEACLPLPPLAEQHRLTSAIESAMTRIMSMERTVDAALRRVPLERQSVLRWAFEGKLVEQDPNDEPASVLLERINTDRASKTASARR